MNASFASALQIPLLVSLLLTPTCQTRPAFDCKQPLSASNMAGVAEFIWNGCPQVLGWPRDTAPRMTGPLPDGTRSVHGFVLNYYSPSVYEWLKAGRPDHGLPDGSIVIKQMYDDHKGKPGKINGWAIMIKQKSGSYDGWLWGYVDPRKEDGGDGLYGGDFFNPNCVACHGSASTKELTFAALANIAPPGTPQTPIGKPAANSARGGSLHARIGLPDIGASVGALHAPAPATIPTDIPTQSDSIVIVGAHGPTGFVTSDVCSGCHDASNLAFGVQANMTWPPNLSPDKRDCTPLTNFSPFGEWGASLMGLAGRDPVFQAQRESETKLYPELADEIDDTCYTCHGVMGRRQLQIEHPGALYTHEIFNASGATNPLATVGALGRDGVSCAACHRMTPEGLGTKESFTGNFHVGDPRTIFGPYQDVVAFPMQNAVGMTPQHGDAMRDPALCGSCHVVETPILDARKLYDRASFEKQPKSHEQTTYLEWLNSAFQTKAAPGPNATPKTCQDCHMPDTVRGEWVAPKIANIEDETYVDDAGKPFANTALAKDITLKPREKYGRHTFVGANVFVLEMFNQFGSQLGLTIDDPNYDTSNFKFVPGLALATHETVKQVQSNAANVTITDVRKLPTGTEVDVCVENLTGHKMPSGVGFRRAFIEFSAADGKGAVVWASGKSDDNGVIVDLNGRPLETEFSKTTWQPHHRTITSDQSVQIYESRTKDPAGLLTTSFLALATPVKDNRLMPKGWSPTGPYADWTSPVGVDPSASPGYTDGAGNDVVTYRIPASLASRVVEVKATLYYQSIPPYYLRDRFEVGKNGPSTRTLKALVEQVNYKGTAAEGWKLRVDGTSRPIK